MNSISATSDRRDHAGHTAPVLLVFAPGLGPVAREGAGRFPALERLAARGRRRPLSAGPWAALAAHVGGDIRGWPVAPVSFLAECGPPRGGCLRLGPVGTDPDRQGLVRIPACSLEVTAEEARALGARFDEVLGEGELALHPVHPRRWYLDGTPGWRGAAGPVPAGELSGEPGLLRLVSETEMLFFDHEVNQRRAAVAAPLVGGIHAWGGGLLPARGPAGVPAGWGGEPYLAGLWRLAGRAVETDPEPLFEAGGVAWPLPAEEPGPGLPARLEDELGPGALRALSRGQIREVRLITDDAIIVTTRLGSVLPWRRPRPLAELI